MVLSTGSNLIAVQGLRRVRVLVRADQGGHDRGADRSSASVILVFGFGETGSLGQHIEPVGAWRLSAPWVDRSDPGPADRDLRLRRRRTDRRYRGRGRKSGDGRYRTRSTSVIYRILIFYIGALIIIMSLVALEPVHAPVPARSSWSSTTSAFPAAAGIINFVVITAAASACNSGIFSTGRMLYTLAQFKQAPKVFGRVSRASRPGSGYHRLGGSHAGRRGCSTTSCRSRCSGT